MLNGEYLEIANMPILWVMVIPTVIMVLVQGYIFVKHARDKADIVGLSRAETKEAIRVAAITSIGPGFSMFTAMIAMMAILGGPFSWLRLSIIGTIVTEMLGANAGAQAMGVPLGGPDYGIIAFTCSVWIITLNTWGFFIVNLIFAHRLEKVKNVVEKRDIYMFNAVGSCIMIGCVAMFMAGQVVASNRLQIGRFSAGVAGFCIMLILIQIAKKFPRLAEYNLGIALISGILIAQAIVQAGGF
jgi:hypothetical protein